MLRRRIGEWNHCFTLSKDLSQPYLNSGIMVVVVVAQNWSLSILVWLRLTFEWIYFHICFKIYFSHSRKKKKQLDNSCRLLKQKMLLINVKGWHEGERFDPDKNRRASICYMSQPCTVAPTALGSERKQSSDTQMTAVTTQQSAFITIIRFQVTATFQQSDSMLQQHSRSETDMLGKRLWIDTLYRHSFLFFLTLKLKNGNQNRKTEIKVIAHALA